MQVDRPKEQGPQLGKSADTLLDLNNNIPNPAPVPITATPQEAAPTLKSIVLKDGERMPPLSVPSGFPVARQLFASPLVHSPFLLLFYFFNNFITKHVYHKPFQHLTLIDIDQNITTPDYFADPISLLRLVCLFPP